MTHAKNEHSKVVSPKFQKLSALKFAGQTIPGTKRRGIRSVSGIILYAKHPVVSNSRWLLEIIPRAKLSGAIINPLIIDVKIK